MKIVAYVAGPQEQQRAGHSLRFFNSLALFSADLFAAVVLRSAVVVADDCHGSFSTSLRFTELSALQNVH